MMFTKLVRKCLINEYFSLRMTSLLQNKAPVQKFPRHNLSELSSRRHSSGVPSPDECLAELLSIDDVKHPIKLKHTAGMQSSDETEPLPGLSLLQVDQKKRNSYFLAR
ncbi:hypothetical protein EVAR_103227_1 [Eumeta japonica]|uniref:Uncharacterized protein n=1 Tax=Eumeta variegata TaxID=151549 RepID=A0A4C1X672_EUMVA|nr:hypothetical protein EVAR_103227_1 [Eumeta japonica]